MVSDPNTGSPTEAWPWVEDLADTPADALADALAAAAGADAGQLGQPQRRSGGFSAWRQSRMTPSGVNTSRPAAAPVERASLAGALRGAAADGGERAGARTVCAGATSTALPAVTRGTHPGAPKARGERL